MSIDVSEGKKGISTLLLKSKTVLLFFIYAYTCIKANIIPFFPKADMENFKNAQMPTFKAAFVLSIE